MDQENNLFFLLTESSPDAIYVGVKGLFVYLNPAALKLFGASSADQLIGREILERIHPKDRAIVAERIGRLYREKERAPLLEQTYLQLDGTSVDVEVTAVPFQYGNEEGGLVFVRDITERKRGEQALKALNRDFVTLLENTSDFIYFKDRNSRFRFCSQTMARITGHRHWRDMIGKHDLEVFPEDTARVYYEEEIPIFQEGIPLLDRIDPYYDEHGQPGWVNTNKWPVFDDDGKTVVGIFGISRIVTERVHAEARLAQANKELQAFTYAASHDLKAPLGRINSFCSLLERDYRHHLEGDGLQFLDFIRQNALRLTALVDDLLEHAQVEQQAVNLQVIDLTAAWQLVVGEQSEEIRQKGAEVRVAVASTLVRANYQGLLQALRNLLANALKYAGKARPPIIEIGGRPQGSRYLLWIRDNGIGFDMVYHDRIFEIFRRLHAYNEYPGNGVGLALVKKAMESMHGKVWADSSPGNGATFFLEFQAAADNCSG